MVTDMAMVMVILRLVLMIESFQEEGLKFTDLFTDLFLLTLLIDL